MHIQQPKACPNLGFMLRHSQFWSSLAWTVPDPASPKPSLDYLAPLLGLYAEIGWKPYQYLLLSPPICSISGDFCVEVQSEREEENGQSRRRRMKKWRSIPNWDGFGQMERTRMSTWCILIGSWPPHHLYLLEGLSFITNHPLLRLITQVFQWKKAKEVNKSKFVTLLVNNEGYQLKRNLAGHAFSDLS